MLSSRLGMLVHIEWLTALDLRIQEVLQIHILNALTEVRSLSCSL